MNKNYHPLVSFTYFASVIIFSMIFMHPLCILISLISGIAHMYVLGNAKHISHFLPIIIAAALLAPIFTHAGETILAYFPDGNPLTLESIIYGFASAAMFLAVICHFSCFNKIMTSDKLMYLFGKISPSFSLIFSMILRFIPKFRLQLKQTSDVQNHQKNNSVSERLKNGIKILSITLTRSLEEAVDTADSMKSRGYGLSSRTAFSNYSMDKRNIICLSIMLLLSLSVIIFQIFGHFSFVYFPCIVYKKITYTNISAFGIYFLLFIAPIAAEIIEVFLWKKSQSKI